MCGVCRSPQLLTAHADAPHVPNIPIVPNSRRSANGALARSANQAVGILNGQTSSSAFGLWYSPQMSTSQPALDQLRQAMAATNGLFNREVFGKRNFDALDQVYTANARILPPGAPMISGRAAIKKFWADMIQAVNAKSAVLTSVEVMPAGDGVVEIGAALLIVEPPGQAPAQMEVKYVVYWRQEDGRWKVH